MLQCDGHGILLNAHFARPWRLNLLFDRFAAQNRLNRPEESQVSPDCILSFCPKSKIPEFRVRYAVLTPVGRFKFDDTAIKLKQEVLKSR